MKTKIVAIHGLIGHGKDTLASCIANEIVSMRTVRKAFADIPKHNISLITGIPLHAIVNKGFTSHHFDFSREQKNTYLEQWGMTLGEFLQKYTTEACRNVIDNNIWIKSLMNSIPEDDDLNTYIVTDVRFENEIEALKKRNATLIKITRPNYEKETGRDHSHESEKGLPDKLFKYLIKNSRDVDYLRDVAKAIVKEERLETLLSA